MVSSVTEDDYPHRFRLSKILWDESSDEDHRTEMFDIASHPKTQFVLMSETENQKLTGFLEASIRTFVEGCRTDCFGYLERQYVLPEYRRHGTGRILVGTAEERT